MTASDPIPETYLVHISCGLVEDTGQYPEYCWVWRKQDNKYCTELQSHFVEAQSDLHEWQQTLRQGGYRANDLVGIKESFKNLAQATAEDRVSVTNLTGANMNLMTQVLE